MREFEDLDSPLAILLNVGQCIVRLLKEFGAHSQAFHTLREADPDRRADRHDDTVSVSDGGRANINGHFALLQGRRIVAKWSDDGKLIAADAGKTMTILHRLI